MAGMRQGGYIVVWMLLSMFVGFLGAVLLAGGYHQREVWALAIGAGLIGGASALFGFCSCMKLARVDW